MDEVLRRRLVGAAVLLAGAFIVASVLPDPARPAGAAGRVVTYDLRTGVELEPAARESRAPSEVQDPAAAAVAETEAGAPAAAAGAAAPRPTLKVDESLAPPAHAWYLQIGSFESQLNARNALQKLYGAGLPATIQSLSVGKKLWYRVRVGPYADEPAAQKALAAVRRQGFPLAKLVRPDTASDDARN